MRSRVLGHRADAFAIAILLCSSPLPLSAESVQCEKPPGPGGEVICERGQMAMCKVDGVRVEGRCYSRPQGSGLDLDAWVLSEMLESPVSKSELDRPAFKRILTESRYQKDGKHVVTVSIPSTWRSASRTPWNTRHSEQGKQQEPSLRYECTVCGQPDDEEICETGLGDTERWARDTARRNLTARVCGGDPSCTKMLGLRLKVSCKEKQQ